MPLEIVWLEQPGRKYIMTCDGCNSIDGDSFYWHCLQCRDFDLCTQCIHKSRECQSSDHKWYGRQYDTNMAFISRGKETTARTVCEAEYYYPSELEISDVDPQSLYDNEHRFISKTNPRQILIYTDGACTNNGQSNAQAGFGFVFRPSAYSMTGELTHAGGIGCPLESKGPTGILYNPTNNRAELRAVIAALQWQNWATDCNEGWRNVVIATDSEYVARGATSYIRRWERSGWVTFNQQTRTSGVVKNQDLWNLLLMEIRRLKAQDVEVFFWRIARKFNERADKFAKQAVGQGMTSFHTAKASGPTGSCLVPYEMVQPCESVEWLQIMVQKCLLNIINSWEVPKVDN